MWGELSVTGQLRQVAPHPSAGRAADTFPLGGRLSTQTKPAAHGACNPRAAVFYRIPVPSKSLYRLLDSVKSLCQIGDDVVDVLGADGQADRVAADAHIGKLRIGELAVGRGGRVDYKALDIGDIGQQ